MPKIVLLLAVLSICASIYYFFIQRDLFLGSILVIAAIAFNLIFAMFSNINIIKK
jgi:hypothetical protein